MTGEIRVSSSFQISTGELPSSKGLTTLRDLFDSKVQLRFEAGSDGPVDAKMVVQGLPGLRRAAMTSSMDVRLSRDQPMLSDGEDDVCLIVKTGGHLSIDQAHRNSVADTGDGVLLVYREPAKLQFKAMNYTAVRVPFLAVAPLAGNLEAAAARRVRRESGALQLMLAYLSALPDSIDDARVAAAVTEHVYDLFALAIGATPEGRELASRRGLRAARLETIKADLRADTSLAIAAIACRQGVSPRYIQMLFEEAGTTFSEFALGCRLERARKMLTSPRHAAWTIAEIALEAGFGDLSYFNRSFRRHYAMTPSDMRSLQGRAN